MYEIDTVCIRSHISVRNVSSPIVFFEPSDFYWNKIGFDFLSWYIEMDSTYLQGIYTGTYVHFTSRFQNNHKVR